MIVVIRSVDTAPGATATGTEKEDDSNHINVIVTYRSAKHDCAIVCGQLCVLRCVCGANAPNVYVRESVFRRCRLLKEYCRVALLVAGVLYTSTDNEHKSHS